MQIFIVGIVVMHRLYKVNGPEDEQFSMGVGAKMGNGLLATLIGPLNLANQGADWFTQVAFGLPPTTFYALNFVDFRATRIGRSSGTRDSCTP